MKNRYLYFLRIVGATIDLAGINALFILSYQIASLMHFTFSFSYFTHLLIINNLFWILISKSLQIYESTKSADLNSLLALSWKCFFVHFLFLTATIFITADIKQLMPFVITFCLLLHLYIILSAYGYRSSISLIKNKFKTKKQVAMVGVSPDSAELANYFHTYEKHYSFENFLEDHECTMVQENSSSLSTLREHIKTAAKNGIYEIYIRLTPERINDIGSLIHEAYQNCVRLKFVSDFSHVLPVAFLDNHQVHLQVGKLSPEPLDEMHNRFAKRLFDICFSLFVILFIISWLYPILAILIKLESPGPVIFKQLRNGRNNAPFWCFKFRSMRENAESGQTQATRNDVRVTNIGRFIRKTSLDELPQFFNVLLGDMSIVGPRPHMIKHTEEYRDIIKNYMARHYSKPGITGWAQVNGFRGETREIKLMQKRVEYDIWYMENWSVGLDTKIILLTVAQVFKNNQDVY